MVGNYEGAGCEKRKWREGDERPGVREVLEVYDMADDGEHRLKQGQRIREVEYDMKQYYRLWKLYSK